MPSWLEDVHTHGEVIHIHFADAYDDGVSDNTFAVASSKKELKQLKKSDADIVYYERKGKLYLNGNGHEKGWGEKDIGGLIVKVKGKPEIAADDISGFQQYSDQDGHGQIDDVDDTTPMQTMFSSKSEAKKAAKTLVARVPTKWETSGWFVNIWTILSCQMVALQSTTTQETTIQDTTIQDMTTRDMTTLHTVSSSHRSNTNRFLTFYIDTPP